MELIAGGEVRKDPTGTEENKKPYCELPESYMAENGGQALEGESGLQPTASMKMGTSVSHLQETKYLQHHMCLNEDSGLLNFGFLRS